MAEKYFDIIYPDTETKYPKQFANHLMQRFFNKKNKKLLDVGCGKGIIDKNFKKNGIITYGLDIRINNKFKSNFNNLKKCDIEKHKFPYPNNTFDYIFSKSVLEHVYNSENMIKEMYRVLKPGGVIVLMVPDWNSQMSHYWDDYTHVHAWTLKSLFNCMKIFKFKNVKGELFYQLPFIWKYPYLKFIPKIISLFPQSWKWKDKDMMNGKDNKLIRFSKEKMILCYGSK